MPLEFQVDGSTRRAALWLPEDYTADKRWPLVVALHGYEERGDEFEHMLSGLGSVLTENPNLYRAVVVLPQCPTDLVWAVVDRPWAQGLGSAESHVEACIDRVCTRFSIDPRRIALTGNSMGGFGTFVIGARRAQRFRCLVPICGGGIPDEVIEDYASDLRGKPVWAIHGGDDDIVVPSESEHMVAALREVGAEVRHTVYGGVGHVSWEKAWRDPDVAEYLCIGPRERDV